MRGKLRESIGLGPINHLGHVTTRLMGAIVGAIGWIIPFAAREPTGRMPTTTLQLKPNGMGLRLC